MVLQDFDALFEYGHDAVFFIHPSGHYLKFNQAACTLLGYTESELMQLSYTELSAESEESAAVLKRLLRGEVVPVYERHFIKKSGEQIPVEIRAVLVRDPSGEPLYIQSALRDIRGKKIAEKEHLARRIYESRLKEEAQFQKAIIDLAIDFVKTPVEQIDAAFDAALERIGKLCGVDRSYYFKYDFGNQTVNNLCEWCGPGITSEKESLQNVPLEKAAQWLKRHASGAHVYIESVANLPEDDPLKPMLIDQSIKTLITVPMMNQGQCVGFVGFDAVTHVRRWDAEEIALLEMLSALFVNAEVRRGYELEIVRARNEAVSANAVKSRFLANIGHEVRTPLNGIIGMLSLVQKSELNTEQKQRIEKARDAAESLLILLNDLLDFSKMEAGKTALQIVRFDLKNLIDDAVGTVLPLVIEKKLTILTEIDKDAGGVFEGDVTRIRQILLNLLINAVKFTHQGNVYLKIYRENKALDISTETTQNWVFEVLDTGIGIHKEQLPYIFNAFYQIDDQKSRQYSGTGLGLTIVKELVRYMHGSIDVQSTLGSGTQFKITLPMRISTLPEQSYTKVYRYTEPNSPPLTEFDNISKELTEALSKLREALKAHKPRQSQQLLETIEGCHVAPDVTDALQHYIENYDFKSALESLEQLINQCEEKSHEET